MSTIEKPVLTSPVTTPAPISAAQQEHAPAPPPTPKWQKYGTPVLVILLAAAVVTTIMWNWNAWEGGRIDQVTDDAYVRGDLTPLSTKVAGIVKDVKISDFQQVHKGDLLIELKDDDYIAQVVQATAGVEAANAASRSSKMPESRGLSQELTRQMLTSHRHRVQKRLFKPM
jgi:membrane fusion protein (multidrug efflux system)